MIISIWLWGLLEKAMAPHSSTLAWKIPWMKEPGRLQSMGSLRVGHDWVTALSLSCTGEGRGKPLQCSCLENPRDRGAWWAAVYGVAQSRTRLKQLSSSSSMGTFALFDRKIICQLNFFTQISYIRRLKRLTENVHLPQPLIKIQLILSSCLALAPMPLRQVNLKLIYWRTFIVRFQHNANNYTMKLQSCKRKNTDK